MSLSDKQRDFVRRRAGGCCEYCLLTDGTGTAPFHVDHIRPRKLHGSDETDNLCFACNQCNHAKGSNVSGYDPQTYAPTVDVLKINETERIKWRQTLLELGEYPCQIDE